MSNFFVPSEVYEKRIAKCKACVYYKDLLGNCSICGCFMKIKARISHQHCPKYYWKQNDFGMDSIRPSKHIPVEIENEVRLLWPDIKSGRAKDQATKRKMFELYNLIYNGGFDIRSSCHSCVNTAFGGIKQYIEKKIGYEKL